MEFVNEKEIVNNDNFPMVTEEEFLAMEIEATQNNDCSSLFVFCKNNEFDAYIEIYIFDLMQVEGFKRFVLKKGNNFCQEDELLFLEYMEDSNLRFSNECNMESLVEKISNDYPDIHLKLYEDFRHVFLHLYYTLCKRGSVEELLFKANLNWIGATINKVEGIKNGSSLPQIFNLQIGMLQAVNYKNGVLNITKEEDRLELNKLYSRFHNYIHGTILSRHQLEYLKKMFAENKKINRSLLNYIGSFDSGEAFLYFTLIDKKAKVKKYLTNIPNYPDKNDLESLVELCEKIEEFQSEEETLERIYALFRRVYVSEYAFEDDDYKIVVPEKLGDMIFEGIEQKNCLIDYLPPVIVAKTVILFMRKKQDINKRLITLEVRHGALIQAKRKMNQKVVKNEADFLKKFAESKNLVYFIE